MRRVALMLLAIAPVTAHAEERPAPGEQVVRIAPNTAYERCLRIERTRANPSPLEQAMLRLKCGDAPGTRAPQRP